MLKKLLVTVITLILLISCATSPLGRKQLTLMPVDQLNAMGVKAFDSLKQETPIDNDRGVNRYVSCIANAIIDVSNSEVKEWEIKVFEDESANAFALPGGKIGVHTGLLQVAVNQHQLAAVLGHEVAHVLANHSNERVSQEFAVQQGMALVQAVANVQSQMGQTLMGLLGVGAQFGILLPYSRIHESEADVLGLNLMAQAGFDPKASIALWQNMSRGNAEQPPEFLSTHPSHETRINDLNNAMGGALRLAEEAHAHGKNPKCQL
jgi:predicted Zn-dependent protease